MFATSSRWADVTRSSGSASITAAACLATRICSCVIRLLSTLTALASSANSRLARSASSGSAESRPISVRSSISLACWSSDPVFWYETIVVPNENTSARIATIDAASRNHGAF